MEIENKPWLYSFTNKRLELILFVTEQCNFRCLYCYEDFKIGKISREVTEGVKNMILSRIDNLDELSLSFFGGEPLLNKPMVLELSQWASSLCVSKNVQYYASITTNGYSLDTHTFFKLIDADVTSYQITLDGERESHNKLRPSLNGKPTFDKIYENLISMANSTQSFSCTIRFNIADSNFDSVEKFVFNDAKPFANDNRFNFHFHPIFGVEELMLTHKNNLKELTRRAILEGLFFEINNEEGACYASKANSFVIRADGRVQKCTVALENELNNIGKIHSDGTMEIDCEKLKKWIFAQDKSCPVQSLTLEKLIVPYENAGKYVQS